MKSEIQRWANFIEDALNVRVKLVECVVDRDHSHKYQLGKWHIYSFWLNENDTALKIGVAGPNSNARFLSQHYNPNSANSNLAKSLIKAGICEGNPKEWIINNTYRINAVFDEFNKPLAHALEAYLHLAFNPRFEK